MEALFLFDGECRFSSSAARALQRFVRPDCIVMPHQLVDLPRWGVDPRQVADQAVFVRRCDDGTTMVAGGADAVAQLLRSGPVPWPALGAALTAPLARQAAAISYRIMATNRYRLPGGTPACELDGVGETVGAG